jgi:D-aspartate ligase
VGTFTEYDASAPLLVVKVGRYPRHHGGLGAIRTLGRVGVPTYAMTEDRLTPAALSRYLTGRAMKPLSGIEPVAELLGRIREAIERVGRPPIVLPTDDEAAVLIAEHRRVLGPRVIAPDVDASLPRRLASKRDLHALCREHRISAPLTAFPRSSEELEEYARTAAFPVVAKVVEPFRRLEIPSMRDTRLLHSRNELLCAFREWPGPSYIMLQEYLPPEMSEDWIFHGYFDASSECLVAFTGVKHRSWPPGFGLTTYASTVPNATLSASAIDFCRSVRYSGIIDMDWRLDKRNGKYNLLDCNPRVGAQFRLFENNAGIDVVRAMHLDLTGRPVPTGSVVARSFVVENLDFASRHSRTVDHRTRDAASDQLADIERAWFATDDPLPFVSMAIRQLGPAYKRLQKRILDAASPRR